MARLVTLEQLIARVRYQADLGSMSQRHPDSELTTLINQSIQELRLILAREGNEYYATEDTGSTVAGTRGYSLPSDFLAAYGISLTVSGDTFPLKDYSLVERGFPSSGIPTHYRVVSGEIWFHPTPDGAYSYSLLYLPVSDDLEATDTFDGIAGWEDWIVYDTSLRALARDDDDEQFAKILAMKRSKEKSIVGEAGRRQRTGPVIRRDTRSKGLQRTSQ